MVDQIIQSPRSIPSEESDSLAKDSSIQFMLTEFNRIQAGEIYNRSSGESRVNLFVTLLSLTGASIVALRQLTNTQDTTDLQSFYLISTIALLFASLVGTITFRLLLERWRLTVIYLRKLARIRQWFLSQDISLRNSLVYTIDETSPPFHSKRFLSSSLVTFVSMLNSLAVAASAMFLSALLFPQQNFLPLEILGILVALAVWFAQRIVAMRTMSEFQKDKHAAFPPTEETK